VVTLTYSQSKFSVNGALGPANYVGDLQDKQFALHGMKLNASFGASYQFTPHFATNLSFAFLKIGASDSKNGPKWVYRNLSFGTMLFETAVTGEFDLINIEEPDDGNSMDNNPKRFTPYLFAGVGLFHFNPYTYDKSGKQVYLQPLHTEDQIKAYALWQFCIPIGIGVKYALTDNFRLSAEFNLRTTFTDYLDDVSVHQYADSAMLFQKYGPQSASLSYRADEIPNTEYKFYGYRGNPSKKDNYYTVIVKATIQLFTHNPKFYYPR
jgi:hypothetical protein